jgi:hypothetical protein
MLTSIQYILTQTATPSIKFWYLAVANSRAVSLVQILAGFCLWLGLKRLTTQGQQNERK